MAGVARRSSFRISPVDQLGRRIDPAVRRVAEQILRWALALRPKLLDDPAVVTNLVEEVSANVSLTPQSPQIRNLPRYLWMSFLRKAIRVKRREIVTVSLDESPCEGMLWTDPSAQFDAKILCDESMAQFDSITQSMLRQRPQGYSWDEIGPLHGMSAHAAEQRCSHALQQLREKQLREKRNFNWQGRHSYRARRSERLERVEAPLTDQCPIQEEES
jgi:DNA-directed RNA polymerase specialized sigma24 family protein